MIVRHPLHDASQTHGPSLAYRSRQVAVASLDPGDPGCCARALETVGLPWDRDGALLMDMHVAGTDERKEVGDRVTFVSGRSEARGIDSLVPTASATSSSVTVTG